MRTSVAIGPPLSNASQPRRAWPTTRYSRPRAEKFWRFAGPTGGAAVILEEDRDTLRGYTEGALLQEGNIPKLLYEFVI
jgi:hypothetical protein